MSGGMVSRPLPCPAFATLDLLAHLAAHLLMRNAGPSCKWPSQLTPPQYGIALFVFPANFAHS